MITSLFQMYTFWLGGMAVAAVAAADRRRLLAQVI